MRSDLVVLPEPNIDNDLGLSCGVVWNHSALRTSFRKVTLKRSLYPFSHGEPG